MKAQMEAEVKAVPTPLRSDQTSTVAEPDADTIPGDISVGQPSQPSSVDGCPQPLSPSAVVGKAPAPVVEQVDVEQPPAPADEVVNPPMVDQPLVPVDSQSSGSPLDEPDPPIDPYTVDPVSWLLLLLWVPGETILSERSSCKQC